MGVEGRWREGKGSGKEEFKQETSKGKAGGEKKRWR